MKILMIAPEPFLTPRGTPISVYQRLFALSALGHEVDLVTYHIGEPIDLPGVTVHRIPKVPLIRTVKPGPSWAKAVLDIFLFLKVLSRLLRKRYDVIHTHEEASFFALVLARIFGTKHVYDMHSSLPLQLINFQFGNNIILVKLFEFLERLVINSCEAVITVGSDLEEHILNLNPSAKIATIENLPVQTTLSPPGVNQVHKLRQRLGSNGRCTVLYTGTFEPYQGLGLLIDSAQYVLREYPETQFVLVGGNEEQVDHWRRFAQERLLDNTVYFTGIVPIDEIPSYLELATVVVSPRLGGTSIPLKLYTYLLSGKPLVATRTAAHTQVLNDHVSILTDVDEEAFAQGIAKLLLDPELGRTIGQRARLFAEEKYDIDNYLARLNGIYEMLEPEPSALALSPRVEDK